MRPFAELLAMAAARKGSVEAVEAMITKPKPAAALARIPDDRWLAGMAKGVFQAGFNWSVVENKWPEIEAAFEGFDPAHVAWLSDDALDELLRDRRVIRQWRKLKAIVANAQYVLELAEEHGSAGRFFANYPSAEYIGLLADLRKRAAYLGGVTGQYFLRGMGRDSFILSRDVIAALSREEVFDGTPGSRSSLRAIQQAFNDWVADGGKSLTRVSRVLAFTVG